ncbi:MAG TPA: NUDIX hydrolase [Arachnia sp.]|nr:NUDIX hydrolase [Arachnia sp.]HMT86194.1 NUDIX hydrolase [Arachnia sp.]
MTRGDRRMRWPVTSHEVLARGAIADFVEDVVATPSGGEMRRQYVTHPGAVAIVPWDEETDRIAVVRQYRHPVGMELVEIPAGLLDIGGEAYRAAAERELAEEVELRADRWDVLVDIATTPGACEETLRIFLARGLSPAPRPEGFEPEGEEAEMTWEFVARADLVELVFSGGCQNPSLVAGLMALEAARLSGRIDALRPDDAPWPIRQ